MFKRSLFFAFVVVLSLIVWLGSSSKPGAALQSLQATEQVNPEATYESESKQVKLSGPNAVIHVPAARDMDGKLGIVLKSLGVTSTANQVFDLGKAIYYFSGDAAGKSMVKSILAPLLDSGHQDLNTADASSTGSNSNFDLKIVGGIFNPGLDKANPSSAMILVYDLKKQDILIYDESGKPISPNPKLDRRNFIGQTGSIPWLGDTGALISAQETCFDVRLDQICYLFSQPDADAQNAFTAQDLNQFDALLQKKFDPPQSVKFDLNNAMTDLLGDNQRNNCAEAFGAKPTEGLKQDKDTTPTPLAEFDFKNPLTPVACLPTTRFAAPTTVAVGKFKGHKLRVIAIISVLTPVDLDRKNNGNGEVYDEETGLQKGQLDAGKYLITAPDSLIKFGNLNVPLYFIDFSGNRTRVPGWVIEGFGGMSPVLTVYIKDQCGGTCWP